MEMSTIYSRCLTRQKEEVYQKKKKTKYILFFLLLVSRSLFSKQYTKFDIIFNLLISLIIHYYAAQNSENKNQFPLTLFSQDIKRY